MHDAERPPVLTADLMGVIERIEQRDEDMDDPRDRHLLGPLRELPHELCEVDPVDELHRNEEAPLVFPEVEDLRDSCVVEPHREAALVEKPFDEGWVPREMRQDALDDDLLFEAPRTAHARPEDLTHAAMTDLREQLVSTHPTEWWLVPPVAMSWIGCRHQPTVHEPPEGCKEALRSRASQ